MTDKIEPVAEFWREGVAGPSAADGGPGHATELARRAATTPEEHLVLAAGGDGPWARW